MTPDRNFGPARIGTVAITPLARRLAGERGIDLGRVIGSGPHGRIVARDVAQAPPPATQRSAGAPAAQIRTLFADVPFETVPVDRMRATIAARLVESKQTVPQFYLTGDVDVTRLGALREEANATPGTSKLSLNDFIIKRGRPRSCACRRPMRFGPATVFCALHEQTSVSRWRSTTG